MWEHYIEYIESAFDDVETELDDDANRNDIFAYRYTSYNQRYWNIPGCDANHLNLYHDAFESEKDVANKVLERSKIGTSPDEIFQEQGVEFE